MSDQKCPFCGEPRTRSCATYDVFRCGTEGPDINGEYETGRVCDMHTYQRLLDANAKEIRSLTERLAAAAEAFVTKHKCQTCGGVRVREAELCCCDEAAKGWRDE